MALTKPALAPANPGQPITAQGWNGIVSAVDKLYDFALAIGSAVVEVSITDGERPIPGATAVAVLTDGSGQPVAAIPPHGTRTRYVLGGLVPGSWTVHVAAPGYSPRSVPFEAPAPAPLAVTLEAAGAVMPDLFGLKGADALTELRSANIQIQQVIDITGRELPNNNLPEDALGALVVSFLPAAGVVLGVGDRARLVLSATIREEPVVTMPSLVGLSIEEAKKVLGELGLVPGEIKIVNL